MNSGKYVFTQIADLIKLTPFRKLVEKYRGNYRVVFQTVCPKSVDFRDAMQN